MKKSEIMKLLFFCGLLLVVAPASGNQTLSGLEERKQHHDGHEGRIVEPGFVIIKAGPNKNSDGQGLETFSISMDINLPLAPRKLDFEMIDYDEENKIRDKYVTRSAPKLVKMTDIKFQVKHKKSHVAIIKIDFDMHEEGEQVDESIDVYDEYSACEAELSMQQNDQFEYEILHLVLPDS